MIRTQRRITTRKRYPCAKWPFDFPLTESDQPSSTFSHACYSHPAGDLGVRRQFATLRLLSPYLEVEEEQYGLIWNLIYNNGQTKESKTTRQLEVLKWVLELCRSELEEYPLWRMLTTLSIDIESVHAGISPRWDSFKLMTFLADLGANLHRVGYGNQSYDVAGPQSPTVLSMRTSFTFFHWRKMLEKGYDVESFVTNELQNSPLVSQGWTKETLVALFEYDFVPYQWEFDSPQLCRQCGNSIRYPREILWERKLEMIRQGGVLEVEELDNRSTNGLLSRDGICGSSVGSDSVASAPAGTMDSKAICAEYDGPRPVSSGDEYVDTRSSWTTDNRPFRSLCDFCDMKPKLASEREESEEDFRPNMPGSFDI